MSAGTGVRENVQPGGAALSNGGTPIFGGQFLFGDLPSLTIGSMPTTTPAAIDSWLGLSPGTTVYGAEPGGQLWALAGAFVASTSGACLAAAATLAFTAGSVAVFGHPTGDRFPSEWAWEPNCYFAASDLVLDPGGPQPFRGNQYSLAYWLVIREFRAGG